MRYYAVHFSTSEEVQKLGFVREGMLREREVEKGCSLDLPYYSTLLKNMRPPSPN